MKPHIVAKLAAGTPQVDVPPWTAVIEDKKSAPTRLNPSIDAVLARYRLPVWVTHEFAPQDGRWSAEEVASGLDRVYRLVLQEEGTIPPALIDEISLLPIVEYARIGGVAQSPLPGAQPQSMSRAGGQEAREAIYLDEAQRFTRGDSGTKVAVLDTGVEAAHPELAGATDSGYDFVNLIDGHDDFVGDSIEADPLPDDYVGHGTHVSGIIAAKGKQMPQGVVPRCRIIPVRVLAAMKQGDRVVGAGLIDNINSGVKWAVDHGADVINMSLGIRHTGGGLPHQEVVDYARRKGVTIVAASGNDGSDRLYYPGALPHVIAVGAVDESGEVAPFSTWGPQVSLVAPGSNVLSSYLDGGYAFSSGTSQAAPFVTGAVAMLKSLAGARGRRLSDARVKSILKQTCDRSGRRFKDRKCGFGRLNLLDAMRLLEHQLAA